MNLSNAPDGLCISVFIDSCREYRALDYLFRVYRPATPLSKVFAECIKTHNKQVKNDRLGTVGKLIISFIPLWALRPGLDATLEDVLYEVVVPTARDSFLEIKKRDISHQLPESMLPFYQKLVTEYES